MIFYVILFIIVIGPIIWFEDKGPIFYKAKRIAKGGGMFKMYKFRSMKVNAPDIRMENGDTYNGDDDPRVTRVGRFIRKTSIYEIPQFLNELLGNMSIDGKEKMKNDDYYAKHLTFVMDVKIVFKTIKTVLFRENINH